MQPLWASLWATWKTEGSQKSKSTYHMKRCTKRTSQRETQAQFTSYFTRFYMFFSEKCTGCLSIFCLSWLLSTQKTTWFWPKKMTQHSLAENCCSWIWEPNGFPRYPAMSCREDSSLISKLPSGYLVLKRLPLWQKGYQLGFFSIHFCHIAEGHFFLVPQKWSSVFVCEK